MDKKRAYRPFAGRGSWRPKVDSANSQQPWQSNTARDTIEQPQHKRRKLVVTEINLPNTASIATPTTQQQSPNNSGPAPADQPKAIAGYYYHLGRYFKIPKHGTAAYKEYEKVIEEQLAAASLEQASEADNKSIKQSSVTKCARKSRNMVNQLSQIERGSRAGIVQAQNLCLERRLSASKSSRLILPPGFGAISAIKSNARRTRYYNPSKILVGGYRGRFGLLHIKEEPKLSLPTVHPIKYVSETSEVSSLRWSPDPLAPAVSCTLFGKERYPGVLCVYREDTLERLCHVPLHYGSLWCHEWAPKADYISLGTEQSGLMVNMTTSQFVRIFTEKNDVFCQQFSKSGQVLLNGCRDGKIRRRDLRQFRKSGADLVHTSSVITLATLLDENYLVSNSMDGQLVCWDLRMEQRLFQWDYASKYDKFKFDIDPSERYVAVGDQTNRVQLFDLVHGGKIATYGPFPTKQLNLVVSSSWALSHDQDGPDTGPTLQEWGFLGEDAEALSFHSAR